MFGKLVMGVGIALIAGGVSAEEIEVKMLNKGDAGAMVFEPAFIKAEPGDVINFVSVDKGHNVEDIEGMLPDGVESFKSKLSDDYALTVEKEGVYGIKCTPHYAMGMVALIQVGEPVNVDQAKEVKQKGKAKDRMADLIAQVE